MAARISAKKISWAFFTTQSSEENKSQEHVFLSAMQNFKREITPGFDPTK
jgi:hypothetical protein